MPWRVDSIQAVAFNAPTTGQSPDALAVWQQLFQAGPDMFNRGQGAPAPVSTASGSIGSTQVTVTCQLGRVDIAISGSTDNPSEGPPAISDRESALASASEYLRLVATECSAFRVALVVGLSEQVDANEVPQHLAAAAGVAFPASSADCIYQFNLKRPFKSIPEMQMNRITTWASGIQQMISITVGQNSPPSGPAISPLAVRSIPIINWKLDFNSASAPNASVLPNIDAVVAELASEMLSIVQNGREAING